MKHRPVLSTLKSLQAGALQTRSGAFVLSVLLSTGLVLSTGQTLALTPMNDSQMGGVTGSGLSFVFDDFRFQMAPTSYFYQIGGATDAGQTAFKRGDYRWIGTTISSGQDFFGTGNPDYTGTPGNPGNLYSFHDYVDASNNPKTPTSSTCSTAAVGPLGCPIAVNGAQGYTEVNNPLVLRVHTYKAVGLNAARDNWVDDAENTVIEVVGATNSDPFRWAFWGEIDALNNNGTRIGMLQNQEIIIGAPVSRFHPDGSDALNDGTALDHKTTEAIAGPVFRMYESMGTSGQSSFDADRTLGMIYHHRLSGDYRFSVNQTGATTSNTDGRAGNTANWGDVPQFTSQEGMYFTNVNTFLPLGQMHYQSLILNGYADGNFELEQTRIPNDPQAYNDFYSAADSTGYQRTGRDDRYYETHGYVRWGDKFPDSPTGVSTLRYAIQGGDPDGPTKTVNQANFPSCSQSSGYLGLGGANGGNPCNRVNGGTGWSGEQVGNVVTGVGTLKDVLSEGGMVFVYADGITRTYDTSRAQNNTLNMLWVASDPQWAGSSGAWQTGYQMQRDGRYSSYNPQIKIQAVNLGSSRAEGMLIQHMKVTSLGAAN